MAHEYGQARQKFMSTPQLSPVIHAPNRLQICAFLSPLAEADFQVLREELQVSDSVLSKHIKQLQDAGYVKQHKNRIDGKRRTWVSLTNDGRSAFDAHVEELRRLVNMVPIA